MSPANTNLTLYAVLGLQELNQPEEFVSDAQVGLIEEAWWSQQRHYLAEIAALTGDEFDGMKLSVYDDGLKLLWDFFPPLYPCPLLWRAGNIPSTGDGGANHVFCLWHLLSDIQLPPSSVTSPHIFTKISHCCPLQPNGSVEHH